MRRLIVFGLVLLVGGVALLLGRPWSSTTAPTPIEEKAVARQVIEPPHAEPSHAAAPAPTATTATPSIESGTFRGRVFDAVTRRPVQEFEVRLVGMPHGQIRGNEPHVEQTFQATDGRFAWQRAPTGKWNVTIAAPGYQYFRVDDVSIAVGKSTRELAMPLRPGHVLKGRVFDQISGAGIGEASVILRDPNSAWPGFDPTKERIEKSRNDGTFVIDGVAGGKMIVRAHAKDHAPREIAVVVGEDTPPVEIGLATGGRIAGMVLGPDGTPAKGMLMLAGPGIPYASDLDETGSFNFANRPAGHYRLTARTRLGNASLDFELAENEIREDIVLRIASGRSVRGAIRGLRPEQLQHTFVAVRSRSGYFSAQPDERGAYIVRGVPPGRASVEVDTEMSRHVNKSIDVPADQDVVIDIVFPPGARLSGRVTQSAKPLAGRTVWVASTDGKQDTGYQGRTAEDGRYEVEGVPPGEYRISVGNDASRVVTIAGDTVANLDIPAVQLGGRVVEDGGTVPIVGVGVHVIGTEAQTAHVRNYRDTDDFGQFRLTGLESGDLLLTAYKTGYEMYREKIAYSSPITNKTITLRKSPGVQVKLPPAPSGEQIRPFYVSEKMPGSDHGIGLWIAVDVDGIGYLPSALAGSTLSIQRYGSQPIVIKEWDGQPFEVKP
jgi:hypothetical protein